MAKNRIELTAPNLFLGPKGSEGGPEAIDAILAERRAKALERSAQMFRVAELERETRRFAEQRTRQIVRAVSRTFEILNNAAHRVSPAYQEATRAYERMVERLAESVLGSGVVRAGIARASEAAEGWAVALDAGARENGRSARVAAAANRGLAYYLDVLPDVLGLPLKGMAYMVAGIAEWATAIVPFIANLPSAADWAGATQDTPEKRAADREQAAARVAKWDAAMADLRDWMAPSARRSTENVAAMIAEVEAAGRRTRGEGTVSRGLVDVAGVPVPLGNYRTLMGALLGRYVAALVDQLEGWTKSRTVQGIAVGVERILRDGSASLSAMAGQTHALITSAGEQLRLTGSRLLPVAESAEGLAGAFESAARASESVAAGGGAFARFVARARLVYAGALAAFSGALYAAKAATSFALFDYYRGALYATASGFFFASSALALGGAAGIVRGAKPRAESLSDAVSQRGRDLTLTVNGDVVTEDDEWLVTHVLEPIASGGYVVPEFAVVRGTGASRASDADQIRAFVRGLVPFRRKRRSKNPFRRAAQSIANSFGSGGFFSSFQ